MEAFAFIVGGVLPYVAVPAFVLGMIYRFSVWVKTPSAGRPTLFPAPEPGLPTAAGVVGESLLFRRLFRADKVLWTGAWLFHGALLLILMGHLRVVTDFPRLWRTLGMTPAGVDTMAAISGGTLGALILAAAIFLIARRAGLTRVREISNVGDYVALLMILGILITGNMMRFAGHFDLAQTREYFAALVTFSNPAVPLNAIFLVHFLLVQVLLIVAPFTKIVHFGGIFFTQTVMQRR